MNRSDTPRTDKARLDILQTGRPARVKAEFAEELERENDELHIAVNVARDLIKTLQGENQLLREELEQQAICNGAGGSRELALRTTIAELQRESLALRADSERLDWLESVAKDLICTGDDRGITIGVASNFQNYATNAATFRAAIDAARGKEAQP